MLSMKRVESLRKTSAVERTFDWKRRPLILSLIAIQVAVPTLAFLHEPPTRLGWQMYSGLGELPTISAENKRGEVTTLSFADFAAASRPEVNWSDHLPAFVCKQIPKVAVVKLTYSTGTQSFECE